MMHRKRAPQNRETAWCRLREDNAMAHPLHWVSVSQSNAAVLFSALSPARFHQHGLKGTWPTVLTGKNDQSLVLINKNRAVYVTAQHHSYTAPYAIQQQGRSLWVMEKSQAFICVLGYYSKQGKSMLWINTVLLYIPTVSSVVRRECLQYLILQDLGKLHRGEIPFPGSEAPGTQHNFHTSYWYPAAGD